MIGVIVHTDPLIRDPVLFIGYGFFFALNPASPISRFSGKVVPSEEVPEGWWGSWVGQTATESLWRCGYWEDVLSLLSFFLFVLTPLENG
jgi:hypothetical protein